MPSLTDVNNMQIIKDFWKSNYAEESAKKKFLANTFN